MEDLTERPVVDYSAGLLILCLIPGNERVALVLNKRSMEVQVVPLEFLKKRQYKDALVKERETDAIISFVQPDGFGSPFGKEDPEDNKDRLKTADREAKEETGSSVAGRIISSVLYTERPHDWSLYSNTVFAANGVGFEFNKDAMCDPNVDPAESDMWPLRKLPIPRRRRALAGKDEKGSKRIKSGAIANGIGTYQAFLRRLIAILLQLDGPTCALLGRPGVENAEDLVRIVVAQIPYRNFFSHRMLKMLSGLGRLDIAVERLRSDKSILHNEELVAQIGANMILWLPYKPEDPKSLLNETLRIIMERCESHMQSSIGFFVVDRLERRKKIYFTSADKTMGLGDSDEKLVVAYEDDEVPEESESIVALREKVEEE